MDPFSAQVDIAIETISDNVSGLLTKEARVDKCCGVTVFDPSLESSRTRNVDYGDGIVAVLGNGENQVVLVSVGKFASISTLFRP
jgi:hypothetical protein